MDKYFKSLNQFLTSKVGAFFVIIPFVKPAAEITGKFDVIFDLWKLLVAVLVFIACIRLYKRISNILFWIILLQIIMLFSTIVQGADIKTAFVQVISVISICIYFDYFFRIDSEKAFSTLFLPLLFMSVLTVISMFVYYPNGMYVVGENNNVEHQNYLWGFDNSSIFNFIPAIFLMGIYALKINRRRLYFRVIFFFFIISLAFFYVFSITALLGSFTILVFFVFLSKYKRKVKIFKFNNLLFVFFISALVLLIARDNLKILMHFANITNKFYSIKARFIIWDNVIDYWKHSPVFGYGIEDHLIIASKLAIDHPHNYFMDVLYRAGILGIFSIVGIFHNLIKGKWIDSRINAFSAVVIFVLFVIAQLDFYNDHYLFYPVLIAAFYSKNIICDNYSALCVEGKTSD